jgi:hypothetical protein
VVGDDDVVIIYQEDSDPNEVITNDHISSNGKDKLEFKKGLVTGGKMYVIAVTLTKGAIVGTRVQFFDSPNTNLNFAVEPTTGTAFTTLFKFSSNAPASLI